jgi:DNA-binding response OmpR family regulator
MHAHPTSFVAAQPQLAHRSIVMHHLLVVDADPGSTDRLTSLLCSEAYTVTAVPTVSAALRTLRDHPFDLILLYLPRSGDDGLALCRRICHASTLPLIVVSADGALRTKVAAFQAGADDYLTTPVDPAELLARIWAALRRAGRVVVSPGCLQTADLILESNQQVTLLRNGTMHYLTAVESRLLRILLMHSGHTLSREALLINVWGDTREDDQLEVTIDHLRHMLELDPGRPQLLVRGHDGGYKYQPSELLGTRPCITNGGGQAGDPTWCRL